MEKLLRRAWNYKHGSFKNPLYRAWHNAKNRCHNLRHPDYPQYGGRGIEMCQRWRQSFADFVEDMGEKPSVKHSIDRIDTNGPYSPDNCRWATPSEQARNKRSNRLLTHDEETLTVAEWSERLGISLVAITARLDKLKWTVAKALTQPLRSKRANRRLP